VDSIGFVSARDDLLELVQQARGGNVLLVARTRDQAAKWLSEVAIEGELVTCRRSQDWSRAEIGGTLVRAVGAGVKRLDLAGTTIGAVGYIDDDSILTEAVRRCRADREVAS
jgi:hypothetical protein